jgi:hypothetical protein
VQIDAMMVALNQFRPTINGYSGVFPRGWGFYDSKAASYEEEATRWAMKRGIGGGLCRVNVVEGSWTLVSEDRDWLCKAGQCVRRIPLEQTGGFDIDLQKGGNAAFYTDENWAGPEPGGQWTASNQAALSFAVTDSHNLVVTISTHGLVTARAPKQRLWVEANQCHLGGIDFDGVQGATPQTLLATIPTTCIGPDGIVVLHFNTDRVRSPSDLRINGDTRSLGVWVAHVLVAESDAKAH